MSSPRHRGAGLSIAAALVLSSTVGDAQTIRGRVVGPDARPLSFASVVALDSAGVRAGAAVADSLGSFGIVVPPGRYLVRAARIGFAADSTRVQVPGGGAVAVQLQLRALAVQLDTVVSRERTGGLTSGRMYVARHMARGKGLFVSGAEIEMSGLPLSEYLARLPGMKAFHEPIRGEGPRAIWGIHGVFPAPETVGCTYARVDRKFIDFNFYFNARTATFERIVPPHRVMAVEIFRTWDEIPPEWLTEGWPATPRRINQGNSGNGSRAMPKCGLIQIWTNIAW